MHSVKPELWSITNTATLSWKEEGGNLHFASNPDGLSAGVIEWKAEGLSNKPITARGIFSVIKYSGGNAE